MRLKKVLSVLMVGAMLVGATGCGSESQADGKIKIVATSFPEYDWVREIIGDEEENFDLRLLINSGVDLHSYTPSVDDIISIKEADLFICNGGESTEDWLNDVLAQTQDSDLEVVNLIEELGNAIVVADHVHTEDCEDDCAIVTDEDCADGECEISEDCVDGECELSEEDCTEDGCEIVHEDGEVCLADGEHADEHVWMSLKNANALCVNLLSKINALDPENKEVYMANATTYLEKIKALDEKYEEVISGAATNFMLVGDRFPYAYLVNDYGIDYEAAFSGCTAETEASFETITSLIDTAKEKELNYVVITETGNAVAHTVANGVDRDVEIVVIDSIQSTTLDSGVTYYEIMESNLTVLETVLNNK